MQKSVLIWLCRRHVEKETKGEKIEDHGIRIFITPRDDKRQTLSERAALSRAIRLLEGRGLITRAHQRGQLFLAFTDFGREIAQPLYDAAKAALDRQRQEGS